MAEMGSRSHAAKDPALFASLNEPASGLIHFSGSMKFLGSPCMGMFHHTKPPFGELRSGSVAFRQMRTHLPFLSALLLTGNLFAQTSFTSRPELLPYPTHSGNCMAVTDMNGDGKGRHRGAGPTVQLPEGAVPEHRRHVRRLRCRVLWATDQQWGMAVADMDNDGQKDAFSGGSYDGQHYLNIVTPRIYRRRNVRGIFASMFMQMHQRRATSITTAGWTCWAAMTMARPNIWINDGQGRTWCVTRIHGFHHHTGQRT
jgi:hypothetical protein